MKKTITFLLIFTASVLFSQVPNYVPSSGLLGWWPFNGNANDESGNGNNGLVNGNLQLTTDRLGSANEAYLWQSPNFNSNDYIELGDLNSQLINQITLSCWVLLDCSQPSNRIISTGEQGLIVHQVQNDNVILKASFDPAGSIWPSNQSISKNEWHHIVFTADSSINLSRFYIDGVLTDTSIGSNGNFSNAFWNIGRKSISSFDGFCGKIDDIGIWNRALTQEEITNLYNASQPQNTCLPSHVPTNGLVGYWPFCGNANDESGNGNHGVLNSGNNGTLNYVTDQNGETYSAIEFTSNPIWNQLGPHIILNNTQNVLNDSNFTINYFVLVNTTNQIGVIINKGSDNTPGIFQSLLVNGTLQNFISGSGVVNQPNFVNNTWKMITVVFNMSGQLDLYVNGVLAQTTTTLPISSTTSNFILGAMPSGGSNGSFYPFQGKLDNVGFWNRALTQQEITNLYNASLSTEDFAIKTINIYPNPTTSLLNFKSAVQVEKILIYNMLGQLVQQEKVNALEGTINIEKLAQGTYLVKVNDIDKGHTIIKN